VDVVVSCCEAAGASNEKCGKSCHISVSNAAGMDERKAIRAAVAPSD